MMESMFPPLTEKKLRNILTAASHLQVSKSYSAEQKKKLELIVHRKIERYKSMNEYSRSLLNTPEKWAALKPRTCHGLRPTNRDWMTRNTHQIPSLKIPPVQIEKRDSTHTERPSSKAMIVPSHNFLQVFEQ